MREREPARKRRMDVAGTKNQGYSVNNWLLIFEEFIKNKKRNFIEIGFF